MTETAPGQVPGHVGPYRIIRPLGAGGMGVVYLGQDERSGQLAAVKLIRPELAADEEFRARLRREVAAVQRVPRFCTAPVLAADTEAQPAWVATEYIDAPTLEAVLAEQGGRLWGAALHALAVGVAVALRALHEHGVIHRDLKPSNILMSPVGPRVIDFGIARLADAAALTRPGDLLGTRAYLAPELLEGRPASPALDIYAWGCVVTLAATGRLPFGSGTGGLPVLAAAGPDLGDLAEPLRGVVAAALEREPALRPTAADLADRLMASAPEVATQVVDTATLPPPAAAFPGMVSPAPGYPATAYPDAAYQGVPYQDAPYQDATYPAAGYPGPATPVPGAYPGATPVPPGATPVPMGQSGYGWTPPPGPAPGAPPARGDRSWLVAVVVVAVAVLLVGAGTTAAVLLLRDRDSSQAQGVDPVVPGQPPEPPLLTDPPELPSPPPGLDPPPPRDQFDFTLDPTFGSETASSGFDPDPMTIDMVSGGSVDASYLDTGCRGYGAQAPDFRLRWEGDGGLLRFFFLPEEAGGDTALVINGPDASWHCNDDSYGSLNPTIDFEDAAPGQYDVWVTTYLSANEYISGTLHITDSSSVTPED